MIRFVTVIMFFTASILSSATLCYQCMDFTSKNEIPYELIDVIIENQYKTKSFTSETIDQKVRLFLGKNYIYIFGNGYVKYIDSVYVKNENEVIEKTFYLEKAIIESTPAEEKYHSDLKIFDDNKSFLRIEIDSVKIIEERIFASITFENLSPMPIYILKTIGCIEPVKGILFDENGGPIKKHAAKFDCVGEKRYPNSSDLILIPSQTKVVYPEYQIYKYNALTLLPGNYYLQIIYEYMKPEYFSNGFYPKDYRYKLRDKITAINKALLGRYYSISKYQFRIN